MDIIGTTESRQVKVTIDEYHQETQNQEASTPMDVSASRLSQVKTATVEYLLQLAGADSKGLTDARVAPTDRHHQEEQNKETSTPTEVNATISSQTAASTLESISPRAVAGSIVSIGTRVTSRDDHHPEAQNPKISIPMDINAKMSSQPAATTFELISPRPVAKYKPSAAMATVFRLPELVEHILVCLADVTVEQEAKKAKPEALQPHMCLSAVQRVNWAFRETTERSPSLQRRMSAPLLAIEKLNSTSGSHKAFVHAGTFELTFSILTEGKHVYFLDFEAALGPKALLDDRSASWRNIKIVAEYFDRPMQVWFSTVVSGVQVWMRCASYEFGCYATLGELCDMWSRRESRFRKIEHDHPGDGCCKCLHCGPGETETPAGDPRRKLWLG